MTPEIRWLVEGIKSEIPARMVSRDLDDDGAPQMAAALEAYVTDGEHSEHCPETCHRDHWRRTSSDLWNDLYSRPFKRALSVLAKRPVPKGRPRLHVVLWCLAAHDGNVEATIAALRKEYAFMWHDIKARRWISHSLWEARAAYREDAPGRELRRKSESQSIAEAA